MSRFQIFHGLLSHAKHLSSSLLISRSLNASLGAEDNSAHIPSRSLQNLTQQATMRLSTATPFSTALVLIHFLQATSALTLTTFQPINGFDAACTNAYNTPLTDCSNSDFAGKGCSVKCVGFLDSLTTALNEACAGTSAYPNTLIGLFFDGLGVQTICSTANGDSNPGGGGVELGQAGGQDGAIGSQSAAREASVATTSTITISTTSSATTSTTPQAAAPSSTTTVVTTPQAAATSSTTTVVTTPQAAATSSTTTVVPITVTPEPTTTSVAVVGTTVAPESPSDALTSTSHTKSSTSVSSTSTSPSNDNGGGTPLDIGSSACHDATVRVWLFALLAGSTVVALVL
ncbi:hypothetical protein HO173_003534 [Letharia columbiana]|uniref:Uncharacterized protein n=1 Tax=Letharia columbiana TaxID=112416 RepID=A0A8H6G0L6_9LECA|nr:uncharacterized protein HO173_003534 [Letharia columbiana]KAF6238254.1 hypothetical protein HO173_003534 [Letharia columbiana]